MRATVVLLIFALFAWAFYNAPTDETIKGALIAAFSGAWGYYLGSNVSSREVRDQARRATDQAREAVAFAREVVVHEKPQPVEVVNSPEQPVPTTESQPQPAEELPPYAR
jgi:hypothetical protein